MNKCIILKYPFFSLFKHLSLGKLLQSNNFTLLHPRKIFIDFNEASIDPLMVFMDLKTFDQQHNMSLKGPSYILMDLHNTFDHLKKFFRLLTFKHTDNTFIDLSNRTP